MEPNRADSFLRLIRRAQRGRLKIYLGYAAGVGKTCQMLQEAHRLKQDGVDVVVGVVETHGRKETEALISGLEVIPPRTLSYRGIVIEEMDLERVILRHPDVVLVDELAHTNVPGSKSSKRYQDVEELIAAGIHVISTLNIQHLESLYETIERATGVRVRERIPDHIVAESDQLVNVDITTEDLRQRLKEGRVYTSERIETALNNFFQPVNLEQLRELTLRELASQIDSRRRSPQSEEFGASLDQIMVCLSSRGPNSEALLRYTSRLAGRLNRNWYAVYVQTSKEHPAAIDATTQRTLSNTLTLAQQLGATVFTYKGEDVVSTILQFAREYRVGHIVIGTPGQKIPFWQRLWKESTVTRLIGQSRGITIIVPDTKTMLSENPATVTAPPIRPQDEQRPGPSVPISRSSASLKQVTALVWENAVGKDEAIDQLLQLCTDIGAELKNAARDSILEREKQGGTFVGDDVAIPHARVPGLKSPIMVIGICRAGIVEPESGRTVRIMSMLLSPSDQPEIHLEMLGAISRMTRDDRWRHDILCAGDSAAARDVILDWADRVAGS